MKHNIDKYSTIIAFLAVVLSWSTSWFMIKFQLGVVPETLSVAYRFFGASIILFIIANLLKFPLKFSKKQHFIIFIQGINLFFFNHLFFYNAIHFLNSGVVATFSALTIIAAPFIDYIIHRSKIVPRLFYGGVISLIGIAIISINEFGGTNFDDKAIKGIILCLLGVTSFSLGSVIGKDLKLRNIKTLISSTAYSMLYGSILSIITNFAKGQEFIFDTSPTYILSLLYLIIIPGIVGYCSILFLVDKIGSIRASYTSLLYPIIALFISNFFENYIFTFTTFAAIILIFIGNLIALNSREKIN